MIDYHASDATSQNACERCSHRVALHTSDGCAVFRCGCELARARFTAASGSASGERVLERRDVRA